tara:strand:+ start:247 stop:414 length:168 start_codon:yes stop_codon:yes gene_type:complete
MELHEEILELLRIRAKADHEYINPHFLQGLTGYIHDYYEISDDAVDDWVVSMFGA